MYSPSFLAQRDDSEEFLSAKNDNLLKDLLNGDRKAVARAITMIENSDAGSEELMQGLYPSTGNAFVIGVTGPPGTGKSTLVDRLIGIYRSEGKRVAVLAVDPTSPISGGAILGDRVRMLGHALDEGVFIRSMASRGDVGGLSKATNNAARILDAAGNDVILVETVGIGQTEVEIVQVADAVVVVLMPELGDEVQAMKAGLMEVGHVFVVNKSDLPGADKVIYNIESALSTKEGWKQAALKVSAKSGEGLDKLVSMLFQFKQYMDGSESAEKERKRKLSEEIIANVTSSISTTMRKKILQDEEFHSLVDKVAERQQDPSSASRILLKKYWVMYRTGDQ